MGKISFLDLIDVISTHNMKIYFVTLFCGIQGSVKYYPEVDIQNKKGSSIVEIQCQGVYLKWFYQFFI